MLFILAAVFGIIIGHLVDWAILASTSEPKAIASWSDHRRRRAM